MKKKKFKMDDDVIEKCRSIVSPMLSIGVLTYNHAEYIADAIDSLLIQEIDYDYEIVIADDFSTDGTREIVQAYAEKYPDIIRLILQEENVGIERNSNTLKKACKGRYRATFEGDDYCLDPYRFQKQIEFLENNQDYIAVGGQLFAVNSNGRPCSFPWGGLNNNYVLEGDFTKQDFENGKMACHTGAWVIYNIFYVMDDNTYRTYINYDNVPGDLKSQFFALYYGKIMVLPRIFIVRRLLWNSPTSNISTFKQTPTTLRVFKRSLEFQKMDQDFVGINLDMTPLLDKMLISSLETFCANPSRSTFRTWFEMIFFSKSKMHHISLANTLIRRKMNGKIKKDGLFLTFVSIVKRLLTMFLK